jgi:hypothetical protein
MPVSLEKIHQMELELEHMKSQLLQEDGRRFQIIMREISPDEKQRILDKLTDRQERILFGLEAPSSTGATRPGKSGGDLECPTCHKTGLTKRGLALHLVRKHKGEQVPEQGAQQGMFEQEDQGVSSLGRRRQGRGESAAEGS